MFDRIRHPVMKLKRISIDGIGLGQVKPGEFRYLTGVEIKRLKKEVGLK